MVYTRDIEIVKGGRISVPLKLTDFVKMLEDAIVEKLEDEGFDEDDIEEALEDMGQYIHHVVNIGADCNISFGTSDMSSEEEMMDYYEKDGKLSDVLGYHEYNGFCWLGCSAGDYDEYNVFFIVYYDGQRFRAYAPLAGNVFDKETYRAFYTNYDEDDEYEDAECSVELMKQDFLSKIVINGYPVIEEKDSYIERKSVPINELNELLEAIEGLIDDEYILGLVENFKENL